MVKADMKKALVQYEEIRPSYKKPTLMVNRIPSADA